MEYQCYSSDKQFMALGIEYIYKNLKYLDFSFTNP